MAVKTGRNAPCPCGSGKKYKKCCLAKDEQERQRAVAVAAPEASEAETLAAGAVSPPPAVFRPAPPPPDPHEDAVHARLEAFDAADYPGQIALFAQTLDEAELMDDENAFEMLNTLKSATVEHDERDRFDDFVEALRTRLPEIYARHAHDYLDWQIINALGTGRLDAVSAWCQSPGRPS